MLAQAVVKLLKVTVDGAEKFLAENTTLAALNDAGETAVKVDGVATETLTTAIAEGKVYLTGYYKVTYAAPTFDTMNDTTAVWTNAGTAFTADTYAKAGDKIVCTLTTGTTGFTPAANDTVVGSDGATAKIETDYIVADSDTAPTTATTTLTLKAAKLHTAGVVSFYGLLVQQTLLHSYATFA